MGEWFEHNGIPVLARLRSRQLADGGDLLWLDSHTLVIGRGFRTNEAGACAIKKALEPYVDEVHVVDLPVGQGADYCLHTLSVISMLDRDLAVVSLPLMPVHLYRLLRARGVELIEIDPGRVGLARAQRARARTARRRHAGGQPEDRRAVTLRWLPGTANRGVGRCNQGLGWADVSDFAAATRCHLSIPWAGSVRFPQNGY